MKTVNIAYKEVFQQLSTFIIKPNILTTENGRFAL